MHPSIRVIVSCGFALALLGSPTKAGSPTLIGGTKLIGGPGGAPYHLRCPPDSFVVGGLMRLDRLGEPLSYYEPICAYIETNGMTGPHFGPFVPSRGAGTVSGRLIGSECPPGYVVFGLDAAPSIYSEQTGVLVHRVTHFCQRVLPPHDWADDRGFKGSWSRPPDLWCPVGKWAVSVYGGAGRHIDSIGLVCDTAFGPYAAGYPAAPVPAPAPELSAEEKALLPAIKYGGRGLSAEEKLLLPLVK